MKTILFSFLIFSMAPAMARPPLSHDELMSAYLDARSGYVASYFQMTYRTPLAGAEHQFLDYRKLEYVRRLDYWRVDIMPYLTAQGVDADPRASAIYDRRTGVLTVVHTGEGCAMISEIGGCGTWLPETYTPADPSVATRPLPKNAALSRIRSPFGAPVPGAGYNSHYATTELYPDHLLLPR